MNHAILSVIRAFFERSDRPRLRRDLVSELREAFGLDRAAANDLVSDLMSRDVLRAMQVHFYDPVAEEVVQEEGVRPAARLGREVDSGQWRAVAGCT